MYMIGHDVSFDDLTLFLPRQFVKDRAEFLTHVPEQLLASFGHKNNMVLAIPRRVGQALIRLVHSSSPLGRAHQAAKGELTPGTLKAVQVSLVEPVAYPLGFTVIVGAKF